MCIMKITYEEAPLWLRLAATFLLFALFTPTVTLLFTIAHSASQCKSKGEEPLESRVSSYHHIFNLSLRPEASNVVSKHIFNDALNSRPVVTLCWLCLC